MEQNKPSFADRLKQEQEQRCGVPAYQPPRSELEEKRYQMLKRIDYAIEEGFGRISGIMAPTMRFLGLPYILAHNDVLGTNTVMSILQDPVEESEEDFSNALEEVLLAFRYVPSITTVSWLLASQYGEKNRSIAECYWLLKLCKWLRLPTEELESTMKYALYVPKPLTVEPIVTRNIDFIEATPNTPPRPESLFSGHHKTIDYTAPIFIQGISQSLLTASTRQYEALEALLRRL